MSNQEQVGGDHSTNIQGENVTINQGFNYSEVREIARDVFAANFYKLAGDAAEMAQKRAEEITEKIIMRLKEQNTEDFSQAKDPDFQYALFEVQKEYAKTGDEKLGDFLVDLLAERAKQEKRTLLQIVLNESIKVVPKLKTDQLAILSVVLILKYLKLNVTSLTHFFNSLDKSLKPHIGQLTKKVSSYQHLEFCGCVTVPPLIGFNLGPHFLKEYPGLFSKGFEPGELPKRGISVRIDPTLFTQCFHNENKIQLHPFSRDILRGIADRLGISVSEFQKLIALNESYPMSHEEVKQCLIKERPYFSTLFDFLEGSLLQQTTLTSVGMAIGNANIKRNGGEVSNLSEWMDKS